jgi:hypothetical protein
MGSGARGSNELFISDLQEPEFDLLFAYFSEDAELDTNKFQCLTINH